MLWVWMVWMACAGPADAPAAGAEAGPPPAQVEVARVRADGLRDRWRTAAEVVPLEAAELASPVAGPVVAVTVRPGDPVEAGALLLEIDRAPAAARLRRAEADAEAAMAEEEAAQTRLARAQRVEGGVLAPAELEELAALARASAARTASLKAAADEVRVELGRHRLRAPFSGHLVRRTVDPGDWVTPGQLVLEVVNTAEVEIHLSADEGIASRLSPGAAVQVLGPTGTIEGQVIAVVPAVRTEARTALVRIAVPEGAGLVPGRSVSVELPLTFSQADGLLIPRDALLRDRSGDAVIRASAEDTAERLSVTVIAAAEDWLMVQSPDLRAEDRLVVRGNERLRPGQPLVIRAQEEEATHDAP